MPFKYRRRVKKIVAVTIAGSIALSCTGCTHETQPSYQNLTLKAQDEGALYSLGMPDDWANWDETWDDMQVFYNLEHTDTDMNSAQELDEFAKGIGDIGDVGYSVAKQAESRKLTLPYKTSYWDEIPDWAKDDNGDWMVAYTGTMAFMVKDASADVAMSWAQLRDSDYTVGTSDVRTSSQAQLTVYAAALALGGSEKNVRPGIEFFKDLAEQGRLTDALSDESTSINSDIDVNLKWDFNALGYRDAAQKQGKQYGVCIPSDGSVTVGYASILNEKAQHPYAAMLAREYIFSDAGQLNLAAGYATPIRSVVLPQQLEEKMIDRSQYRDDMIQAGLQFNDEIAETIAAEWEKQVLPILEEGGRAQ